MAHIDLKKNRNVGEYRHRIEIQRLKRAEEPDEMGIIKEQWVTIYAPRAKVSHMSGKEYLIEHVQPYSRETMRFWFRTHPTVKIGVKDRVLYDGRQWDIKTADNINDVGMITYLSCEVCE